MEFYFVRHSFYIHINVREMRKKKASRFTFNLSTFFSARNPWPKTQEKGLPTAQGCWNRSKISYEMRESKRDGWPSIFPFHSHVFNMILVRERFQQPCFLLNWKNMAYKIASTRVFHCLFGAKKLFLYQIVTGDGKWIYFDNLKRHKSWIDLVESRRGRLLLWAIKPNETADRKQQLIDLIRGLNQKRPTVANTWTTQSDFLPRQCSTTCRKTSQRCVICVIVAYIPSLGWWVQEISACPAYSPDIAPSFYHLFRSMQHSLVD